MATETQAVEEETQQTQDDAKTQAQAVEFSEATDAGPAAASSINILLDMNVPITAVIDKKDISVQRLLQLGPGSVLKLNKPVGAPVDLYLKDVKFATATAVVIDDRFAVRIKQICGPGLAAATPAPAEAQAEPKSDQA